MAGKAWTERTLQHAREKFLATLARGLSITAACAEAGIGRSTAYHWRDIDEVFAAEWETALEQGTDVFEDEARRRAIEGTDRPVFYEGRQVGSIREYSDTLMVLMLKARRPTVFRERIDHAHSGHMTLEQLVAGSMRGEGSRDEGSDA
jgi:AcrR family transcriptional regulator